MTLFKIDGATRVVNAFTSVHETATTYNGRISPAEAHARVLARQAERWITFAGERTRMTPRVVTAKALDSLAFSVQHRAHSLAVPSKLSGTREHQRTLWALVREGHRGYEPLSLDIVSTDGVAVRLDDRPLGQVQPKHVPWVRPLVAFGLRLYLAGVTGSQTQGYTLGVNVVVGHVGEALGRLQEALGTSARHGGDGLSGDGQGSPLPVLGITESGEPSTCPVAVPCLPLETLPGPLDTVLYRTAEGRAVATLDHIVRHSPTGIEWGYAGAGPADLALSLLARVAGMDLARRHYHAFLHEVVSSLPYDGGLVQAADVQAWLASQQAS